jgi:hypothetical protein
MLKNSFNLPWIKKVVSLCSCLACLTGCASTIPFNDFFGIAMEPDQADKFKIVTYSEQNGASYYSNSQMNPNLFAWAEIDEKLIWIKIVNMTGSAIPFNYNLDRFSIVTTDKKDYILVKGERQNYPVGNTISTEQAVQFQLLLPSDFWKSVGLGNPNDTAANYVKDFWQGKDSIQIIKEKIEKIIILLAGKSSIVLKPVPEK